MFNFILGGDLNPPMPMGTKMGQLVPFDQDEFFEKDAYDCSMDTTGYVYVPPACEDGNTVC